MSFSHEASLIVGDPGQAGATGLVARAVDPQHGRIRRAAPTQAGLTLLARADPGVEGVQEEVLAGVPREQRAVLESGMRAAMAHLSASGPE